MSSQWIFLGILETLFDSDDGTETCLDTRPKNWSGAKMSLSSSQSLSVLFGLMIGE